jgi:hypothetical protein
VMTHMTSMTIAICRMRVRARALLTSEASRYRPAVSKRQRQGGVRSSRASRPKSTHRTRVVASGALAWGDARNASWCSTTVSYRNGSISGFTIAPPHPASGIQLP